VDADRAQFPSTECWVGLVLISPGCVADDRDRQGDVHIGQIAAAHIATEIHGLLQEWAGDSIWRHRCRRFSVITTSKTHCRPATRWIALADLAGDVGITWTCPPL